MIIRLSYRHWVLKAYYSIVFATLFSELIILRINLVSLLEGQWWQAIIKGTLASTIPLSILIRLYFYVRPRILAQYELYPDHLKINFKKTSKELWFSQIEKVRFSWIPPRWGGGFIVKVRTGQQFVFLSLLEKNDRIIETMAQGSSHLIDSNRLKKYLVQTQSLGVSWKRMRRKWRNWPAQAFKYLVVPILMTILTTAMGWELLSLPSQIETYLLRFLLWFGVMCLFALAIGEVEDRLLLRLLHGANDEQKKLQYEHRVILGSEVLYYLVVITILLSMGLIH